MSVARGFGLNGQALYSNIAKPCEVNLNFTVTPTNGLGITSLKSNGYVNNVFMHTSTTPTSNNGTLNPNPASGYALIQMKQNFNYYIGNVQGFVSTTTGSIKVDNGATLTVGNPYIITTLGDATAAQWTLVGVPAGITPAVGVSFIAIATGGGSGNTSTSRVSTPLGSGISSLEVIGNPNVMTTSNIASNSGQLVLVQFLAPSFTGESYTPAGTISAGAITVASGTAGNAVTLATATTLNATGGGTIAVNAQTFTGTAHTLLGTMSLAATAPTTGSIVSMTLKFDGSSVTIDGI